MNGSNGSTLGVNLAFTKFLFVTPVQDDDAARTRLRAAGSVAARGFFNDFEAEGGRDTPHETIQFLLNDERHERPGLAGAPYVLQVSSKYRPRLAETEMELRRRLAEHAGVTALDGAMRSPQYTSAEMHAYAYKHASPRAPGRSQRNAIIIPIRKTQEWWDKNPLDRHAYFYPHADAPAGPVSKGTRARRKPEFRRFFAACTTTPTATAAPTSSTSSPTSSARTTSWKPSIRSAGRYATSGRTRNGVT